MSIGDVVRAAADLITDGDENPEYDRALVEMVGHFLGIDLSNQETRDAILGMLRAYNVRR
jgi:hypothetical protein